MKTFFLMVLSLFLLAGSVSAQSPLCNEICGFYYGCVEQNAPRKLSADEKTKVKAGCLNSCKKHTQAVAACFESHKNQCKPFNDCLVTAYNANKK
ncbi:Cys-rich protein [Leptospira gomenensis]|uniref:Cys-rich protein n=1 Tax=Leptospira gomenensis TaxID=2484974 RepID=A0A5F1Y768_9LEPT|nr:Cys-rich protein [Leptospira gomenensis]TGK28825.1 Cys-rich protein [Leptospira gomenensis]TGK40969.1 Cys-rich protein [Leptospira gomenensis]TGK46179.1 Cys-rich protein [Leptospira gomenensis]TGK54704.1 Cys-rich protein [Leptospira gomenensis]